MRRVRLPLYLKILAWFFLNLVLLAGAGALLLQAQFSFNLDWLLATGARDRLEAAHNLIIGELNVTHPDEWPQVMDRFSTAYQVRFGLFDEDAYALVGQVSELPDEVRERIQNGASNLSLEPTRQPPSDHLRRPPVRMLLRTVNPTQYWMLASARIENPQIGEPMRVLLVANSDSISGGGLIFNPAPWIAVGLGAFVFSLLFWLPLVSGITRSIGQMTQATSRIADGRFDVRLNARRRDELGSLAESINQMAARLDGYVQGQKRFLGDIAHELCSPLARLQLALGILEQRATDAQAPFVESASEKAEQMSALVGELLSFSKAAFGAAAVELRPVNARAAAEEAVRRETVEGAEIIVEIPPDLFVAADADLLIRALSNLLRNALSHAAKAGPVILRGARYGDEAALTVADSGPGVPEEELPKIFEPFYRVDAARTRATGNAGLGLPIVKTCIQSCCGSVTARNRQPRGFEVQIQLSTARPSANAVTSFSIPPSKSGPRML